MMMMICLMIKHQMITCSFCQDITENKNKASAKAKEVVFMHTAVSHPPNPNRKRMKKTRLILLFLFIFIFVNNNLELNTSTWDRYIQKWYAKLREEMPNITIPTKAPKYDNAPKYNNTTTSTRSTTYIERRNCCKCEKCDTSGAENIRGIIQTITNLFT